MPSPIRLYRHALSGHAHRVELLLSLLGLPHELIDVDLLAGAQKSPEFLAKNPFGQVPVIEDGPLTLADSNAILVYLASRYDEPRRWLPTDPVAAAQVQRWLSVAAGPQAPPPAPAAAPAPKAAGLPAPVPKPVLPAPKLAVPAAVPLAKPVVPPAAGGKPGVPAEVTPIEGPYTLAQATAGLVGTAPLRAVIDVEKEGKPLGTLRCELFADKAPLAVANFVGLARGLRPFRDPHVGKWVKKPLFDGNQFHRVIPDFMIQAGDTWCFADQYCGGRHGAGDPGYAIPDEIREDLRFDRAGRLGMALRGAPNTSGSQFFITDRDTPWLNGSHTIFGQCEPAALIHTIATVEAGRLDVPAPSVFIKRVTISRQQPLANK